MTDTNSTIPHIPTQLYLISPLEVGGDFPQRLGRALEAGKPVLVTQGLGDTG